MNLRKKQLPGMFDTPTFLNLHLLLWDSYISNWMSGRLVSVEDRRLVADTHLAFARSQNRRKRHFGFAWNYKRIHLKVQMINLRYFWIKMKYKKQKKSYIYKRGCTKEDLRKRKEAACFWSSVFLLYWKRLGKRSWTKQRAADGSFLLYWADVFF